MPAFDPSKHLMQLKGKDYLEVKYRLMWFRETHPDGVIDTENIALTDQLAVFKATVQIPSGGRATGYGSETPKDFGDYIEKAETKALGRALGALGFGTQFTDDFDEGTNNPVDAPRHNNDNPPYRSQAPMPARSQQTATNTASIDTLQPNLATVDPEVHDWSSLWSVIRKPPYRIVTRDDFAELVQRTPDQFNSPQHALNAVKKALRERDAAIDSGQNTETAK
jgi:hypothetical protein